MPQIEERSLTITAIGEPGSVFLTPCEPIVLHHSVRPSAFEADDDQDTLVLMDQGAEALPAFSAANALAELRQAS
jgi:hypothetical protein